MRLGFVGSMAALLAGTGLVLGQAPDYQQVQGGMLPSRQVLPNTTMSTTAVPENGQSTVPVSNSSGYDCLGCGSGGCGAGACGNAYSPPGYVTYANFELLIWNIQRIGIPATSGLPVSGLLAVSAGGEDFFTPVFANVTADLPSGDSRLGGEHLGSRVTVGCWLGCDSHFGLEVSGFILERRASEISASVGPLAPSGAEGETPGLIVVAVPGDGDASFFITSGFPEVQTSIANELWGFEINGRCGRYSIGALSFGTLAGARYIHFREDLSSATNVTLTFNPGDNEEPPPVDAIDGSLQMSSGDNIQANNRWYGYQVGGTFEWCCGPCYLNGFAKFGLGGMRQSVDILSQSTSQSGAGPILVAPGGALFNAESNGHHSRTRIAGIMEGSISVGYQLTSCIRTYLGYDYLYMMRVVRPTNQSVLAPISLQASAGETDVNFPNVSTPIFRFNDRDMWVQGVHFGLEVRY